MPESLHQYFAFISYSHKDKSFACELLNYLEHYHLPAVICKRSPLLPRSINPVFLDEGNLPPGILLERLHAALKGTRFLLVICSQNSAQPNEEGQHYVDEEINYFCHANPEDGKSRIIPIIYRENDNCSLPSCLPPALGELGLDDPKKLTIDTSVLDSERCFNNVIATMLGIDADMLWEHWSREQKKRRRWRRIRNIIAGIFVALTSLGAYAYFNPTYSYYADYVIRDNIPCGVHELLNPDERQYCYRFEMLEALPLEVICCNSEGKPINPQKAWLESRPVGLKVEYDSNLKPTKHIHTDELGRIMAECRFPTPEFIDIRSAFSKASGSLSHLASSSLLQEEGESPNGVSRLVVTRNEKGYIIQEIYQNDKQQPVPDEQGIWGRQYQRDHHGRELAMFYLGKDGHITENRLGIAGYKLTYQSDDADAPVIEIQYVDSQEKPTLNTQQWASVKIAWDDSGNIHSICYHGTNGKHCLTSEGYATMMMDYDEEGHCLEQRYYDDFGFMCTHAEGFSIMSKQYHEDGLPAGETYFNSQRNPCLNNKGIARVSISYHEQNKRIRVSFRDTNNAPCLNHEGIGGIEYLFNSAGLLIREICLGTDGEPILNQKGYAQKIIEYDENGNLHRITYTDTQEKRCRNSEGYASFTARYSPIGRCIEERYDDENGNRCLTKAGYSQINLSYDSCGRRTKLILFGLDQRSILCADGYAGYTQRYDEKGNHLETACFDTEGKPCVSTEGWSRFLAEYDSHGNCIKLQYFDAEGKECADKTGIARFCKQYDENNNCTQEAYFGPNDTPALCEERYAACTRRFDADGRCTDICYLGTNGLPCTSKEGFARCTMRYNEQGRCIEEACFGPDGTPVLNAHNYATCTRSFDAESRCTDICYLGPDGQPILSKEGYATYKARFNEEGECILKEYHDAEGKLITQP